MANEPIEGTVTDISESVQDAQKGFKRFTVNHPRTAKVVGYAAVAAATIGALTVWKARKQSALENVDAESDAFDTSSQTA